MPQTMILNDTTKTWRERIYEASSTESSETILARIRHVAGYADGSTADELLAYTDILEERVKGLRLTVIALKEQLH